MLLVLDNFEHLLNGAPFLAEVLVRAPRVKMIVTSRERLYLQEEWIYEVQGLDYPPSEAETQPETVSLDIFGAVRLFVQSARRIRPDFALRNGESAPVARICRLVQGMPLAVELAAAWLQVLSPEEIADEIARRLDFLAAPLRSLPERHRSVRAVIESSWNTMTPDEQVILSRFSVFRGGFTREAAQAVADASLPVLMSLVGKSLLRRTEAGRYEMHELLNQFAAEKLREHPQDQTRTFDLHSAYYTAFLKTQEEGIKNRRQIEALNAIESEIDNVRAAWGWAVSQCAFENIRVALPALALLYDMRSRFQELKELLERAAEQFEPLSLNHAEETVFAEVLVYLAVVCNRVRDFRRSREYYEQATAILESVEQPEFAMALVLGGLMRIWRPEMRDAAEAWIMRGLHMAESVGDQWIRAAVLRALGDIAHNVNIDYSESDRLYRQALEISRSIGDYWGESIALKLLGEVAYTLCDYPTAEALYREGLRLSETLSDRVGIAWALDRIGVMLSAQGKFDEALPMIERAIEIARLLGDWTSVGWSLFDAGEVLVGSGRYDEAEHIFQQSLDIFDSASSTEGPAWVNLYRSRIAFATGNPQRALDLARQSFEATNQYDNLWTKAAARYYLGEALIALGDAGAARGYLVESVQMAAQAKSVIQRLRHLVGIARLLARTGDAARALELLAFIMSHPAAWQETRNWATRLFDELAAELPAEVVEAARTRAQGRTLDDVVEEFTRL